MIEETKQLSNHDWFDYLSLFLSIGVAILIIFLQRAIDNRRQTKDNQPVITLGKYDSFGSEFQIGNYFGTDIEMKLDRTQKSQIAVPLFNIGRTPISNVTIKYEVDSLDRI